MKQFGQVPITVTIPFGTFDPRGDVEWLMTLSRDPLWATAQGLAPNCHENSPVVPCSISLPSKSLSTDSSRPKRAEMSASGGLHTVEAFIRILKDICAVPAVEHHSDANSLAVIYFDISSNSTRAFCELFVDFERTSSGFDAAVFSQLFCTRLETVILRKMLLLDQILYVIAKVSGMARVFSIPP